MKSLCSMNGRWLLMALLLAALALSGCSGSNSSAGNASNSGSPGSTADPGSPTSTVDPGAPAGPPAAPGTSDPAATTLVVQGNLVGYADAALTGAPLAGVEPAPGTPASVPLTGPVSVVLVDETASVVASQTVTADNGNFILVVPTGHSYMMLFRNGSPTGTTISPLIVDRETGRVVFSLPAGSTDVNLGNMTIDSQLGKAWCWSDPSLPQSAIAFPFDYVEWRGTSDVPTEAPPTPLFGAQPFTQEMMLFEEFGPEAMPASAAAGWSPFPQPQGAKSGPVPAQLESFLAQAGVAPYPTRLSNVSDANPWKSYIEGYLGRQTVSPAPGVVACPAEGRPSGEDWAQQNWDQFYPQKYFKTAVAPARDNGGFRDTHQRHGYSVGEFGPGGLYHNVAGVLPGTTNGLEIRLHPEMPTQKPNSVWTFDGTLPPKLLQARYGETILMRNYNALPIDETANNGFGRHTITTHEHNGHSPGESDGFAGAFFYPGQFYDYHWPLQLAGFSNKGLGKY